jgi:Mg chelatase-like protein
MPKERIRARSTRTEQVGRRRSGWAPRAVGDLAGGGQLGTGAVPGRAPPRPGVGGIHRLGGGPPRRPGRGLACGHAEQRDAAIPPCEGVLAVLARLATATLVGLTAYPVGVEVDIGRGLPAVMVVGLGDTAVLEARDRLRAAFGNAGFAWPDRRVTISLPPADLPKQGSGFDLPIGIGLLVATGVVAQAAVQDVWAVGELGLGGDVRGVRGVLATAIAARDGGARLLVVPAANLAEAALVPGLPVGGVTSLGQVEAFLRGQGALEPPGPARPAPPTPVEDLSDVHGQPLARRALEIAAAGGHNLLLVGPPGAGKTMLARRLRGLLPDLDRDEALEVTQVLSAAGLVPAATPLATTRPFRAPHHAISMAGLIGGGSRVPRPGEISLAHASVRECPLNVECNALRYPLASRPSSVLRDETAGLLAWLVGSGRLLPA